MPDLRTGVMTTGAASTNPRTSGGATYNPYNLPTGGYGEGADPFGSMGAAAGLATSSAQSNLAAAPDIAKISELINSLNEAQQQQLNIGRLGPQGQQLQSQIMANAQAGAAGQLTPSELRVLQDTVAQSWGGRGFGVDSQAGLADYTNRYLRTQYQREQDAANTYAQLLAENPSAPLYNAANLLVTPAEYSSTASAQAQRQIEEEKLAQQAYEFEQQMELQRQALAARTAGTGSTGGRVVSAGGLPAGGTPASLPDTGYLYATGVTGGGEGGVSGGGGVFAPAWQEAGYPSEQAYNEAIDASLYNFGYDLGEGGGTEYADVSLP